MFTFAYNHLTWYNIKIENNKKERRRTGEGQMYPSKKRKVYLSA
jgi:hypothetical protein